MNNNQLSAWRNLTLMLVLTFLFGLLVYLTLIALPVAANDFPNCGNGTSPLPPAGVGIFTVTGAVISADGTTPVACVEVFAFSGAAQAKAFTNNDGQYTLTLSAGIYDLVFHSPLEAHLASQARRWIRETQILNVTLPTGYIISGTVYSDVMKTKPVPNVNIFASNPDTFVGLGAHPTGPTGTYQIVLEEGRWELTFTPPHFLGLGPTRTAVISLTQDITQDIILPPGFTVYGRVMTSGNGVADVDIFAEDPDAPPGLKGFGITATDPDGFYTGTLPTGDFDILFFAPPFQGLGSTVVTHVIGPPDIYLDVVLPAGHTVSGTVKCGQGLANTFVHAAPHPPLSAGRLYGWGRFTGADGFYALALQPGLYTFSADWPDGSSPDRIVPTVEITKDLPLNFGACTLFLPLILKNWPPVPKLNPINNGGDGNYIVSWQPPESGGPYTYTLQEDDNQAFNSPNIQPTGSLTSITITGRVQDTYYYRVKGTSNAGDTPWSNVEAATVTSLTIDDFDDGQDPNSIGGLIGQGWPPSCPTSLSSGYISDGTGDGSYYYISYNVTPTCYGVWETGLLGQDYSSFSAVTFQIKGALGNERPHVWLQDTRDCQEHPDCRHYVEVSDFLPAGKVTTEWQQARIPLSIFVANGVHLTDLKWFQIAFEWATMNSTIYIDNIRFE